MKIIILHNEILTNNPDEIDVLAQRDLVEQACKALNHEVTSLTVGENIIEDIKKVQQQNPDIVFNLVESTWGKGELIYFAPAILNSLKIPYTGVSLDALFITTNKVLAKKMMLHYQLPTAEFYLINEVENINPEKTYIVKPIWEEASVGINIDSIFKKSDKEKLEKIKQLSVNHYFVEEFIDGREFNISMLTNKGEVEVLSPAEMIFSEYFDDKPKIVDYKAKWEESSEQYKQTNRAFDTVEKNSILKIELENICKKAWKVFGLKGYVRIDFRVDNNDNPYILEINGNPCIAPDSGFVAAINKAAYKNEDFIKRILEDLN